MNENKQEEEYIPSIGDRVYVLRNGEDSNSHLAELDTVYTVDRVYHDDVFTEQSHVHLKEVPVAGFVDFIDLKLA